MSLMNDALRKQRSEKKHPSGVDFLKPDPAPKSKRNIKMAGLVTIGLLVCAIGGYFGYEYYSLSRPIAPPAPAPVVATSSPPPAQTEQIPEVKNNQETDAVEPLKTAAPIEQKPDTAATATETKSQTPPLLKTESSNTVPSEQKESKGPAPAPKANIEKASRQASSAPTPVIEPDGPAPASPSQKPSLPPKAASNRSLALAQDKSESIADRFYRKGLSYHRQNDLDKAIPMYLAARKKDPNHRATSFNLASAYIQIGAFAEAQAILTDLHVNEPDNPDVLLNMAVVELGLNRPEQALAFLDRAQTKASQPRYEVFFHQGAAHSRLGNFTEALDFYQKAANMAPEKARLSLNIAIAYDNLTQYDQAVQHYLLFLERVKNLDLAERREIETRVRELKAYLAQQQGAASQ